MSREAWRLSAALTLRSTVCLIVLGLGNVVRVDRLVAQEATTPVARDDDVKSVDAILGALYAVISGPAGEGRDWDRFRSLFAPGARLIPTSVRPDGGSVARVFTPEDYAQRAAEYLQQQGFFEREIARQEESFGNIAQVFSTYESRHAAEDAQPFARGINSIQLLRDGQRWWIVTIFWDSERPGNPIPTRYLPGG